MEDESQKRDSIAPPVPVVPVEVLPPLPPPAPPVIPPQGLPHGLSRAQVAIAFAIAALSDLISGFASAAPPIQWGVDIATAAALFVVLGWRWLLLPGLIMEAIPGLGVVPFWVLVVAAIAVWGRVRPGNP